MPKFAMPHLEIDPDPPDGAFLEQDALWEWCDDHDWQHYCQQDMSKCYDRCLHCGEIQGLGWYS